MSAADRELRAEIDIPADPMTVWRLVSDFDAMRRFGPETVTVVSFGSGLREGRQLLGINRRKLFVWPTHNVVREVIPGRRLVWDTTSSGARWIFDLEPVPVDGSAGTRLIHTRPVPRRLTRLSGIVAPLFLGGNAGHADELEQGMATTLRGVRAALVG